MATAFISVMTALPWRRLMKEAPEAVETARRLLASIRRTDDSKIQRPDVLSDDLGELKIRVQQQHEDLARMKTKLVDASQLLFDLSEGHSSLVEQARKLRQVITALTVVVTILALVCLWLLLRG